MITQTIIHILCQLGSWVMSLFPSWSLPTWVSSTADTITSWLAGIGAVGYFVPLGALAACAALVLAAFVAAFAIRAVRIGASFATLGGGSAA